MANLPHGFTASDRPDIITRVFNLKLKAIREELCEQHILGKPVVEVYTIKFQKRGLPHAHILLILQNEDKVGDVEGLDDIICAEIPDRNVDPDLYEIMTSNMLHGPCSATHPNSPCMRNGPRWTKRYPQRFCDETTADEDGYPIYLRRQQINREERTAVVKGVLLDNHSMVPYNPYLSKRFKVHINVKLCSRISAFKYLFKYVFKGGDRTTGCLPDIANCILCLRYISAETNYNHYIG